MNTKLIKKNTSILFIALASFFTIFGRTEASIISIKAPTAVSVGERISVDILVDPEDKSINSIESTILFSSDILEFNGFSAKQSSIPIWVEEPKEKKKGSIYFSGVIPGGIERLYDPLNTSNTAIPLVRLFFIAKSGGTANFIVSSSSVLENDGKGTATNIVGKDLSIKINPGDDADIETILAKDEVSPKPFSVNVIERSVFGKTPRLAVFSAEDDVGAIERYEIAIGNAGFQEATSPYPLPYRLFSYTLTARAYDYSGNFQEQQITIPGEKPYGIGVGLIAILLCWLLYRLYNRVKRV